MHRRELTARQKQILRAAVELGYYSWPRRVTLTNLAGHLGIAKSTLSEALMIVESVVMRAEAETLSGEGGAASG